MFDCFLLEVFCFVVVLYMIYVFLYKHFVLSPPSNSPSHTHTPITHCHPTYVSRPFNTKQRQDCKPSDNPEDKSCAKNNDPAASYYETPEKCCSSKLGYINQKKCQADSKGIKYQGSYKYYANYKESKCSQDCPITKGGDCNGVVEDSSTALYPDAAQCCATSLSYMNSELCESKSDSKSTGTGKYYHRKDDDYCGTSFKMCMVVMCF